MAIRGGLLMHKYSLLKLKFFNIIRDIYIYLLYLTPKHILIEL